MPFPPSPFFFKVATRSRTPPSPSLKAEKGKIVLVSSIHLPIGERKIGRPSVVVVVPLDIHPLVEVVRAVVALAVLAAAAEIAAAAAVVTLVRAVGPGDLTILAAALDALVGILVERGEVLPELLVGGGDRVTLPHRGELQGEVLQRLRVKLVLMGLHRGRLVSSVSSWGMGKSDEL